MKEGEEGPLKTASEKDYVSKLINTIEGSDDHYNMFESMISGRNMHDKDLKPN